ncbi:unnamed protein product [Xylocopa violacea]|uniref:N-acetyltransferase domain-containing protein n=1 Tax=Xylocopa violacea TaxID=135666 RepID=A0ABP1PEC8_XYLVO
MYGMRNLSEISWIRRKSSVKESDFFALSLRVAAIRKLRPYDDLPCSDAPIVWQRLSSGYRIVDLQLDKFMLALHFILVHRWPKYSSLHTKRIYELENILRLQSSHRLSNSELNDTRRDINLKSCMFQTCFCQAEPTFKAVGVHDDAVSMKSFMTRVFNQMENMMSLCALQEGSNELVGVLIVSRYSKPRGYAMKEQGETLRQAIILRNYVIDRSKIHLKVNAQTVVSIDILCVKADHQKNGVGTALLQSCVTRASSFATACIGLFTSGAAQTVGTFRFASNEFEAAVLRRSSRSTR